jgi:Tol biopolymer transport system component
MSPQPSIAHYRITSKLGEGGMGEVWRATDTKLGRDVAIKILPDSFAADPDRLARFTREAQVLASLNHPNIAVIHGVEDRALIMELVEGSTLTGPLSEEELLPILRQLIDALEYAHEKGIVHRDLKPANLKLTPEGRVKVLDFGIAKAMSEDVTGANPANSPTLTMRATQAGVIMGTAAYMSPEQARGQLVDKRSDIWSFGVVVHELLTGRQAFAGETVSDTLAAVLKTDPDLSAVPPRFQRLLRLCLTRDPRQRLRDISGARLLLDEPVAAVVAAPVRSGGPWKIMAAVAALAAIGLAGALWRAQTTEDRPLTHLNVELAPDAITGPQMTAAISPDGRRIVYRTFGPSGLGLYTRTLDQAQATALTAGATPFAFFSPDSRWLGFFQAGKLMKVPVAGGAPVPLCDAIEPYGAVWLSNGNIVASLNGWNLDVISSGGGTPKNLRSPNNNLERWPQALTEPNHILATSVPQGTSNFENADIVAITLDTGARKTLIRGGYFGRFLPSGHLLYVHQNAVYGVRFDPGRLETSGEPVLLLDHVAGFPTQGAGHFDFSQTGTFVYNTGVPFATEQPIAIQQADGHQEPLGIVNGTSLRISPDGKRVAYKTENDIYVRAFGAENSIRITFDPSASSRHPIWSPNGTHLAYAGKSGIWWTRADGGGQPVRILEGDPPPTPWSFAAGDTPRQVRLVYHKASGSINTRDIWVLPLDLTDPDRPKPGAPEVFLATPENEVTPMVSPDGKWMAYSVETGVFVRRYRPGQPADGGKWEIALGRADFPVWSRTRPELFYRDGAGYIMAMDYSTAGDSFVPGKPHRWSESQIYMTGAFQDYDFLPDGKRAVVVARPDAKYGTPHPVFLFNFFDELKRRLP